MSYRSRHARNGWRKRKRAGLKPASIADLLNHKPFIDAFTKYMEASWDAAVERGKQSERAWKALAKGIRGTQDIGRAEKIERGGL